MKVKIFRFNVSNATSYCFDDDKKDKWYQEGQDRLVSEEKIEEILNDFIKDKSNVSITVTPIDVHYHNNARGNDIDLIYTVMYE